jgi:hypothetical protein
MAETYAINDPFLNKTVDISHKLIDRLRGRYANGPIMPNGEPEFGWREFQTPPVQHEAAAEIERLRARTETLAFALERANSDLADIAPRSDTGSKRGHKIAAARARIQRAILGH